MTALVTLHDHKPVARAHIDVRGLSKEFAGVPVLRGVELRIPAGSKVAIVGPRGAGKTTLLSILAGLQRPSRGEARICGLDVVRDAGRLRRRVGYLPQAPRFYGWLTGRETLQFAARFLSLGTCRTDRCADEVLARVGLANVADHRLADYSPGMRRRLGLAQALLGSPTVLLLDEPGMLLDTVERAEVLDVVRRLPDGVTMLFSTDVLHDAEQAGAEVALLRRGRLLHPRTGHETAIPYREALGVD